MAQLSMKRVLRTVQKSLKVVVKGRCEVYRQRAEAAGVEDTHLKAFTCCVKDLFMFDCVMFYTGAVYLF